MPFLAAAFSFAAPVASASALAAFVSFLGQPPIVSACYALGLSILLLGLIVAFRRDMPRARGLDKFLCLGPVFFAAPLAVFAGEHFTIARDMAGMVPPWIPWHLFWVFFVGLCLVAAALSLAAGRVAGLAAALLGVMFSGFVALMDVPYGVVAHPHDRFAWILMLRELTFGLCAFAFASTLAGARWRTAGETLATAARIGVGAVLIFYGVEQFVHPQFVPVIPLELPLPAYLPVHALITCGVGAAEVVAGAAMIANRYARLAATWLGIVICAVVLLVYGPILASKFSDVGTNLNYFADTLFFGGGILLLAGSIPPEQRARAAATVPAAARFEPS
ncbi:MAG TPA: hypothetical protein VHX60_12560 [Acidobacteriaceae bacterium]|jgi:uncharacterized membrane protein|nr:hypothetical protein [Acidobacteriaceae bacterium]